MRHLTDIVRVRLTEYGAGLINTHHLGKATPAVAGEFYTAPLWDLMKALVREGFPPEKSVEDGTFELLAD